MKLHEIADITQQGQIDINRQYVEAWLNRMKIKNYTIQPNNVVDVDGEVNLSNTQITNIPIQFGEVTDNFFCNTMSRLKSLKGCPHTVGGDFYCYNTPITSLEGAPKIIYGVMSCDNTPKMRSISGIHKIIHSIHDEFWCSRNVTHILGLLLIENLLRVDIDGKEGPISNIINKYIGTGNVIMAQDELLDAGFIEQAKL